MTAVTEATTIDYSAWERAVERVLTEGADVSTELLAVANEWLGLGKDSRAAARKWLNERSHAAVMDEDGRMAKLLYQVLDACNRARSATSPRQKSAESNPATHIASLALAYSLAVAEASKTDPDITKRDATKVTSEMQAEAQRYRDWLVGGQRADAEPEVGEVAKAAARLSLGRSSRGAGRKPKTAAPVKKATAATPAAQAAETPLPE